MSESIPEIHCTRNHYPLDIARSLQQLVKDPVLLNDIQKLLQEKKAGAELQQGPRIDSISSFLESELDRLLKIKRAKEAQGPVSVLDDLFQSSLLECWGRFSESGELTLNSRVIK